MVRYAYILQFFSKTWLNINLFGVATFCADTWTCKSTCLYHRDLATGTNQSAVQALCIDQIPWFINRKFFHWSNLLIYWKFWLLQAYRLILCSLIVLLNSGSQEGIGKKWVKIFLTSTFSRNVLNEQNLTEFLLWVLFWCQTMKI